MSSQILAQKKPSGIAEQVQEKELLLGKPLRRKEDPRLVTGRGKFVDDLKLHGMLYSSVLRSTYAHAKIRNVDLSEAKRLPGVKLILTAENLPKSIESLPILEMDDGTKLHKPILAKDEVAYVGEPIAYVVATSRYEAEDALESISIDYDPLPAIVDPEEAIKDNAPKVHAGLKTNLVSVEKRSFGDVESAFKKATKVIEVDYLNQRLAPSPLEPRACIASYDEGTGILTVWISHQGPFQLKSDLSAVLGVSENKVRVIAPDVGGGFGAKISLYSEEVLTSIASMRLGLSVKWIESRTENFLAMTHGRGQKQHVAIASSEKGRILGLKVKLIGDAGAYLTEGSSDSTFTIRMAPGQYTIPAYQGETCVVLTNKVPHDAYRGASRPEATYLIERSMDELARELKMDPAEIRLRNYIPMEDFPYTTVGDLKYDSGDYAMNLRKALELSHYDKWREEQRKARREGRIVGIGLSSYVEICAFGPEFPETAAISVTQSGKVTVISGTSPHGQGHEAPFAQIVADKLGLSIDEIHVVYGDTNMLPWGTFTAGSRSAALGGSAVLQCAIKIRDKMAKIASKKLVVSDAELVFRNGQILSKNDTSKSIAFSKIADYAYKPSKLPSGVDPVLFEFSVFIPSNYTFPFGTHVAVVEIDRETGNIKILDYTSVDDCGRVLNPLVVQGQIHGGITQGIAQALLEGVEYDQNGQLLTSSFSDYQIPLAEDVPNYNSYRTETPTDSNPLGIKGIGEAGTIAGTPAIANAVADALSVFGSRVEVMPLKPHLVRKLLKRDEAD